MIVVMIKNTMGQEWKFKEGLRYKLLSACLGKFMVTKAVRTNSPLSSLGKVWTKISCCLFNLMNF